MSPNASPLPPPSSTPLSLKAERIQLRLETMPDWVLSRDGKQAQRRYKFRSRSESIAFLRQAITAAETIPVAFGTRGPTVTYRGDAVTVSIWARHGSFVEPDLDLVRAVSALG